jgi:hypothetical protein
MVDSAYDHDGRNLSRVGGQNGGLTPRTWADSGGRPRKKFLLDGHPRTPPDGPEGVHTVEVRRSRRLSPTARDGLIGRGEWPGRWRTMVPGRRTGIDNGRSHPMPPTRAFAPQGGTQSHPGRQPVGAVQPPGEGTTSSSGKRSYDPRFWALLYVVNEDRAGVRELPRSARRPVTVDRLRDVTGPSLTARAPRVSQPRRARRLRSANGRSRSPRHSLGTDGGWSGPTRGPSPHGSAHR